MPAATTVGAPRSDLLQLLAAAPALDAHLVAEARKRPPEEVTSAVEVLLEAGLDDPDDSPPAIRAVHLAAELRLPGAAALLRHALRRLPEGRLRGAVLAGLARLGADAVGEIAAAYGAAKRSWERGELAEVLASISADDPRIRAALLHRAREEPDQAARHLARRGDWQAVPGLLEILDAQLRHPAGDCLCCVHLGLGTVAEAVRALGGTVPPGCDQAIDDLIRRADFHWVGHDEEEEEEEGAVALPARRERPGRNAPCWCGSGRKYRRCHLEQDRGEVRH